LLLFLPFETKKNKSARKDILEIKFCFLKFKIISGVFNLKNLKKKKKKSHLTAKYTLTLVDDESNKLRLREKEKYTLTLVFN
jgi:hypothetical protein